ncbi:MAG: superoxide dismutase, Ni [Magnetovibrionaceae bacterium]
MLHKMLSKLDSAKGFEAADAHCDIPCKIYDPIVAQIAALTAIRMIDQMNELEEGAKEKGLSYENTSARLIAEKEEQVEIVKHEVRVIWGDYIKAPQIEKFPNLHELAHSIMLAGSKVKQGTSREDGLALLGLVNDFAEIFWATKEVKTKKAVCPYPPSEEVVYPDL